MRHCVLQFSKTDGHLSQGIRQILKSETQVGREYGHFLMVLACTTTEIVDANFSNFVQKPTYSYGNDTDHLENLLTKWDHFERAKPILKILLAL